MPATTFSFVLISDLIGNKYRPDFLSRNKEVDQVDVPIDAAILIDLDFSEKDVRKRSSLDISSGNVTKCQPRSPEYSHTSATHSKFLTSEIRFVQVELDQFLCRLAISSVSLYE
jgi:hypothetical protein